MNPEDRQPDLDSDDDSSDALTMEQINELLAKEDPRFVEGLKDLDELKAPEGIKLKSLGIEMDTLEGKTADPSKKKFKGLIRFLTWPVRLIRHLSVKRLLRRSAVLNQRLKRALLDLIRNHVKWWGVQFLKIKRWGKSLTPVARNTLWMMFFCLMAIAGAAASLGKFDMRNLIRGVQIKDLRASADQVYQFEEDAPRESFFSPLRRPEAYILLESMVVQLRSSQPGSMPKLYVEYIVEASSQRAAHEIQQKAGRFRDQIARVGEDFSIEEMRTPQGKDRLKIAVQKRINEGLQTGYVRNVYFKKFLTL